MPDRKPDSDSSYRSAANNMGVTDTVASLRALPVGPLGCLSVQCLIDNGAGAAPSFPQRPFAVRPRLERWPWRYNERPNASCDWRTVKSRMSHAAPVVARKRRGANMQHNLPTAAPLWKSMKDSAYTPDQILDFLGIAEPPIDVDAIAHQLGVLVRSVANPGWSGALRSSERVARVFVDSQDPAVRRRFTLAHELGHLMLHPLGTEFRDRESQPLQALPRKEREANQFAEELLMPEWLVRPYVDVLNADLAKLASAFCVSRMAMEIRLQTLYR